jgi:hypothetical protein
MNINLPLAKPLVAAITMLLASPCLQAANFATSGVYDEQVTQMNAVDATAPASNVTLANFTTSVAAAFTANTGGVISFDTANEGADVNGNLISTSSFTASYGASQTNTLTITAAAGGSLNTNTNNTPISGTRFLGTTQAGSGQSYAFSTPVSLFGITALNRGTIQTITPTLVFASGATLTLASFSTGTANTDTFFGYSSPSDPITRVNLITTATAPDSTNLRVDDLGFVVVPEPSSMALGLLTGFGVLGLVRRRRA